MWDDPKALNAFAATLASIAVALLAIGAVVWAARNDAFALREVVVATPLARSSPANLEAAIRSDLSGTFFTLDLDAARAALVRVPWVRNVSLRRQWPGRLEIAVEEHVPYARWGDSGLVNAQGEIFAATHDGELPQFDGPDARVSEVTARHREWSALLAPLDLRLRAIAVSPRGGWRLKAGSEDAAVAIELGRDEPDARLARFVAAYGRTVGALARSGTRVGEVDLRYRNGFAARVPGFREKPAKRAL
ncbi:MAG: cell division protein FtsQ/DivIB [Betaproteobacteria bacterium]|nr:cell division protein FtsQ/DivIB [Betaproteobacteria bacterium]